VIKWLRDALFSLRFRDGGKIGDGEWLGGLPGKLRDYVQKSGPSELDRPAGGKKKANWGGLQEKKIAAGATRWC